MSSAAILLMAAAASAFAPGSANASPAGTAAPVHRIAVSATASVRILRAERIDLSQPADKSSPRITIRRDANGTRWIEFS